MAQLPVNNTTRWKVRYQQGNYSHTFEVRTAADVSPAAFGAFVGGFLDSLGGHVYLGVVTEVQRSVEGSDIFLPFATGLEGVSFGEQPISVDNVPRYIDFVGRSSGGRRVRLAIFGYAGVTSEYRVTAAENPEFATAIGMLNGSDDIGVAIDGMPVIWKPYVNVGYNAYWQRAVRA